MEFLREHRKQKILRTVLYDDQKFDRFELEIIHTPIFQRLYDLKQLGFADRVFPDAVHSRFNHVIGTVEMTDRMCGHLGEWLNSNPELSFEYSADVNNDTNEHKVKPETADELRVRLEESKSSIRLMALLHDLTHAAFGHTLEDEVRVFSESHDSSNRQARFFDALISQLVVQWHIELGIGRPNVVYLFDLLEHRIDREKLKSYFDELKEHLDPNQFKQLLRNMRHLHFAMKMLLYLDDNNHTCEVLGKGEKEIGSGKPNEVKLLISDLIERSESGWHDDVQPFRDCWMLDIIGNTICADLMDYTRRDTHFAGLHVDFDVRFLKYLVLVSVGEDLGLQKRPSIRLAIQFFTNKLRNDVLTDMSSILKARYILHERVLFHPTKCAADSLLGSLVQLLGLRNPPPSIQVLGDVNFLFKLRMLADEFGEMGEALIKPTKQPISLASILKRIDSSKSYSDLAKQCVKNIFTQESNEGVNVSLLLDTLARRTDAALILLWKISARRYPNLVYRIDGDVEIDINGNRIRISEAFSHSLRRYNLERNLENFLDIPLGSATIHCPAGDTSIKAAEALVVGKDLTKVLKLRDLSNLNLAWKDRLKPYQDEFRNVEKMYRAIWRFHVYIDTAYYDRWPLVEGFLAKIYPPAQNDPLLKDELESGDNSANPYYCLSHVYSSKVSDELMPVVISRIAEKGVARFSNISDMDKEIERIILEESSKPARISRRSLDRKTRKPKRTK